MSACWPLQMPPTPKAVLISLADNANDNGVCWPSITKIAERTCFGRTAVIDAIRWLEENGLVVADRSNGRHTSYVVTPDDFHPDSHPDEPVRDANRFASRTGSPRAPVRQPNPSGRRLQPVRQADTNRQEPSLPKTKKAREPANGSRLPPDWCLPPDLYAWAREYDDQLDVRAEAEQFKDHWHAKSGADARKSDWAAAWRTWIRNAVKFRDRNANRNASRNTGARHEAPRKLSAGEQVRAAIAGRQQPDSNVFVLDGESRRVR